MLKRLRTWIALVVWLSLIGGLTWFDVSRQPPYQPIAQAPKPQAETQPGDQGYSVSTDLLSVLKSWAGRLVAAMSPEGWTAAATILLVVVTALLVAVAYGQNRTSRRQLRAYVFPDPKTSSRIVAGGAPVIGFNVHNDGSTPASEVEYFNIIDVLPIPLPHEYRLPTLIAITGDSKSAIWPRSTHSSSATMRRLLTDQDIINLRDHRHGLYIFALVKYRDTFKRRRFTRICAFLDWERIQQVNAGQGDRIIVPKGFTFGSRYNDYS